MNITYVKELGNSKMRLALFSYAVSFVVICIITILIILLIKTKKKELVNHTQESTHNKTEDRATEKYFYSGSSLLYTQDDNSNMPTEHT